MALFENIWLVLWKVKSRVEINSRISKTFLVLNGLSWRDELRICTAILMNVECLRPDFVVIYGQARLICGWPKPKSATSSFIMRLGCWISDDVGWHHLGPMKLVRFPEEHLLGVDLMGLPVPSSGTPAAQWRPKSSIPTFGKTLLLLKILKMRAFGVNFKQWWNFVVLIAFGSSNACKADQMSRSVKCESSLCKQLLSELSRPIVFLTGKVDKRSNSSTLNCKSNSALYSIAA